MGIAVKRTGGVGVAGAMPAAWQLIGLNDGETTMIKRFDQEDVYETHCTWNAVQCSPVIPHTQNFSTSIVRQALGSLSRVETQDYHKRQKAGELLPLNAYTRWDYRNDRPFLPYQIECCAFSGYRSIGGCERQNTTASRTLCPDDPSFTSPVSWDGIDTNALVIAAMADVLPGLDALTTAVESKQTWDMIKNVRRDAKDLISEALRGGKHTVKAASDAWLAWRYGWQQLGYDCKNIADFVKRPLTGLRVTGQSGESSSWSDESSGMISASTHAIDTYEDRVDWDISYRARVVAQYRLDTLNYVADVPLTLWEKIPYSFVADWFVNIGDVLAAWKLRRVTSGIVCSVGTRSMAERLHTYHRSSAGCTVNFAAPYRETLEMKTRVPHGIPNLIPSINVNLTGPRITDVAALLAKRIF